MNLSKRTKRKTEKIYYNKFLYWNYLIRMLKINKQAKEACDYWASTGHLDKEGE